MTRFAWLQSRLQSLTVGTVLAVLAVAAAITGIQIAHLYTTQVAHCATGCDFATAAFGRHDIFAQHAFDILALVAPALFGIFWGAPLLAREFESGSYRLAWTQSVTRARWLTTKLTVGALTTIVAAGALSLTITWWYRAFDIVGANQYDLFERRGIVPIGYAVFAFAVGALLGAVIRRVVPAMAATLGVFVFARIAVATWVRPHLLAPAHKVLSLADAGGFGFVSNNGGPLTMVAKGSGGVNSWTQSTQFLTSSGRPASGTQLTVFLHQHCPAIANPPPFPPPVNQPVKGSPADEQAFHACRTAAARAFHLLVSYQPAGRYWAFQWIETGIFVALALLAAAGCYWWVTRRIR